MCQSLADQLATTALSGGNADFIEDLYEKFLKDPGAVEPAWAAYFGGLQEGTSRDVAHSPIRERLAARVHSTPAGAPSLETGGASAKQGAVSRLIQIYANRGHLAANLDPLGLQQRAKPYVLNLEYFGLSDADLNTEFFTGSRNHALPERAKLKDILTDPRNSSTPIPSAPSSRMCRIRTSASGCRTVFKWRACSAASAPMRRRTFCGS